MGASAVKIVKKKTVTEVAISGPMTIDNIAEIRNGMLKAFDIGKKVQLSLSAVIDLDVTGLQLLCSSHRSSIVRDLEFSVIGMDGALLSSVTHLAGMLRHTGCDQDTGCTCVWKKDV